MNVCVIGRYFDGQGSRCHDVEVLLRETGVAVLGSEVSRDYPLGSFTVSECSSSRPRILQFDDGSRCELPATPALDAALRDQGLGDGWVASLPGRRGVLALSILLLVGGLISATIWGIPAVARLAAHWTPPAVLQAVDREALAVLDARVFSPSELSSERQQQLRALFKKLTDVDGTSVNEEVSAALHFRSAPVIGPNAMALPGGSIVLLDELVELADDPGVMAVLAHELGHVRGRHGLDLSYRSAAGGALAAWLFGDISALVAVVPTVVLQAFYSRDMEREADRFALLRLARVGGDPAALSRVLELLYQSRDPSHAKATTYLDSHPAPSERLNELRTLIEQQSETLP